MFFVGSKINVTSGFAKCVRSFLELPSHTFFVYSCVAKFDDSGGRFFNYLRFFNLFSPLSRAL